MHGDGGGLAPGEVLDRWPTIPRTAAALRRTGAIEIDTVIRTRHASEVIERDGVEHRFVHDTSRTGRQIARAVRGAGPDVVHVNGTGYAVPTIALALPPRRPPRIVVQHHGEPPGQGRARLAQATARRAVDGYLFTGALHGQTEPFVAAGILRTDTPCFEVLESASDVDAVPREEARRRTGVRGDPAIGWVGRLIEGKDPLTALFAFSRVLDALPGARLWIVAASREMETIVRSELLDDAVLSKAVEIVGPIPHRDMGAWFSSFDVFLSTSRREGSGYSLIEALTCGCSAVVSDIPPHRAIAGPGGRRFPVGDAGAAAASLVAAAFDPVDQTSAASAAAARLGWDTVARQLLVAYGVA